MTTSKRRTMKILLAAAPFLSTFAALDLGAGAATFAADEKGPVTVYVGTYTNGKSEGIYRLKLDRKTGELTKAGATSGVKNPSFLALHPSGRYLYAVCEVADFGKNAGGIAAFEIDPKSGDLKLLNQQSSGGGGPCHLVVDKLGKNVLAANYGGGSVCVLPIGGDGRLGKATAFVQHKGSSVDRGRQESPHAHSINLDAANRFAFAADLGLDKVLVYRFDAQKGTLAPNDPPAANVKPGSGPRHFAFHPSGRSAYVINEMSCTVTAFDYDADKGVLTETQTITTLPRPVAAGDSTAEVQVHPSGKFLYGSNRGHDSIAIFAIDADSGRLTTVGNQSTEGKTPRNFGIDPSGA
ncbi:MAG TPA: lactonase family protein, partial [Pirellulales bacterium]|nr:lactonase family protein [Pirellulales bacterium]